DKAGVKPGDVVVSVDGAKVDGKDQLSRHIASKPPGASVRLQLLREGAEKTVNVTLGTFPEEGDREADEGSGHKQNLGMTRRGLAPDLAARLELPRAAKGVVVMDIEAGSAAEQADLQRGDVIVNVNGRNVADVDAFEAEITRARPDGMARLRVRRNNSHSFL